MLIPFADTTVFATEATLVAGRSGDAYGYEGYIDSDVAPTLDTSTFGSLDNTSAPGGGVVGAVFTDSGGGGDGRINYIAVTDDNTGLSTISIDAVSYTLTLLVTSSGYDLYTFSDGTQRIFDGNTYTIGFT